MADEKRQSRKLTFRELADKHGREIDPNDLKERSRNRRMLVLLCYKNDSTLLKDGHDVSVSC
jgi:hypothetical protein